MPSLSPATALGQVRTCLDPFHIPKGSKDSTLLQRHKLNVDNEHEWYGHLVVNPREAEQVREMFRLYAQHRSLSAIIEELGRRGWTTKAFRSQRGKQHGGRPFQEATLLRLLTNAIYVGQVAT